MVASIAFARRRQCAPHQTHASLGPTHLSLYPKRHLDWFSHFCTAHGRRSLYFYNGSLLPPSKLPWRMGGSRLPSDTCFLGSTPLSLQNGISIGSTVFTQLTAECSYSLQWATSVSLKTVHLHLDPRVIHSSLGHLSPHHKLRHLDWFSGFCRGHSHDSQTD